MVWLPPLLRVVLLAMPWPEMVWLPLMTVVLLAVPL